MYFYENLLNQQGDSMMLTISTTSRLSIIIWFFLSHVVQLSLRTSIVGPIIWEYNRVYLHEVTLRHVGRPAMEVIAAGLIIHEDLETSLGTY